MSWLRSGALPITGARWSAGAAWAEDGNPQATDSDWEDDASWPLTYPATAEQIPLGVFVAGVDATADVQAASWGLGQSGRLPTAVQPSSCSLTLRDSATPAIGDRLAILTDWDVLWVGRIETVDRATTVERETVTITAVDDLARLTDADITGRAIGFALDDIARRLLAAGGVPAVVTWASSSPTVPSNNYGIRSGTALAELSAQVYQARCQGVYTPAGLRLTDLASVYDNTVPTPLESFGAFGSLQRRRAIADVINQLYIDDTAEVIPYDDAASIAAYGPRPYTIDTTGYTFADAYDDVWATVVLTYWSSPRTWYTADARIADTDDLAHRLLPFDQVTDDDTAPAEAFRAVRVSHRLTPDAWSVTIEGVALDLD